MSIAYTVAQGRCKTMVEQWLKEAIVSYLKNHSDEKPNSIAICGYFKLRVDLTLLALRELESEGRITRHDGVHRGWNGNHYYQAVA